MAATPTSRDPVSVVAVDLGSNDLDELLPEGLTRSDVVAYLHAGTVVLSARGQRPDRRQPDAAPIPIGYRSDGTWVWPLEAERYVERDAMALPAAFIAHIATHRTPPALDEGRRHRIAAELSGLDS